MADIHDRYGTNPLNEPIADDDKFIINNRSNSTDDTEGTDEIGVFSQLRTWIESFSSYFNKSSETSDSITQGSTNLFLTPAERTKITGVQEGAEVNLSTEELQDLVAAMFQGGTHTNASINYDDATGTIDITASGEGTGGSLSQEEVEDFVGGLTTAGTGISVNYDDAGNILTISLTGESFTTAEKNKLSGIEENAKDDQTGAEIEALLDALLGTGWKTGGGSNVVRSATEPNSGDLGTIWVNLSEPLDEPVRTTLPGGLTKVYLTQAEYDAIATPNPNIEYNIIPA